MHVRSVLLLIILVITIVIILIANIELSTSGNFESLAIGVTSSIIAAIIFLAVSDILLKDASTNYYAMVATEAAVNNVLERMNYVPSSVYPESSSPDEQFEKDHHQRMLESSFYYFKGLTASYATERLENHRGSDALCQKEIRILILDPREITVLKTNIKMKLARSGGRFDEDDIVRLANDKRDDIINCINKLYKVSRQCNVSVKLHKDYVFYRSELFTEGLFLSYYDGGKTFPANVYYSKYDKSKAYKSHIYAAYFDEFNYKYDISEPVIWPEMSISEYTSLTSKIFGDNAGTVQ